jgi:PadR family transcriptional regulator, regulatory protein PadR
VSAVNPAWVRGVLPVCLLGVLEAQGRSYGYALLSQLTDAGLGTVKPTALYPALTRMEEEGAVEVEWAPGEGGPGRKYYQITPSGRQRLAADRDAWHNLGAVVSSLIGQPATDHQER